MSDSDSTQNADNALVEEAITASPFTTERAAANEIADNIAENTYQMTVKNAAMDNASQVSPAHSPDGISKQEIPTERSEAPWAGDPEVNFPVDQFSKLFQSDARELDGDSDQFLRLSRNADVNRSIVTYWTKSIKYMWFPITRFVVSLAHQSMIPRREYSWCMASQIRVDFSLQFDWPCIY